MSTQVVGLVDNRIRQRLVNLGPDSHLDDVTIFFLWGVSAPSGGDHALWTLMAAGWFCWWQKRSPSTPRNVVVEASGTDSSPASQQAALLLREVSNTVSKLMSDFILSTDPETPFMRPSLHKLSKRAAKEAKPYLTQQQQQRYDAIMEWAEHVAGRSLEDLIATDTELRQFGFPVAHAEAAKHSTTTDTLLRDAASVLPPMITPYAQSYIRLLAKFTSSDRPLQPDRTPQQILVTLSTTASAQTAAFLTTSSTYPAKIAGKLTIMGGLTRLREKMRQRTHISRDAKHFTPTAEDRCHMMYKEAGAFATNLKECEKSIRKLKLATADMLEMTEKALTAPLPHIWDVDPQTNQAIQVGTVGEAHPDENSVRVRDLGLISKSTVHKMDTEVLTPMNQWLKIYKDFKNKFSVLEQRRLDFDAERRQFNRLEITRVRQQQSKDSVDMQLSTKLSAKGNALNAKRDAFIAYEAQVHNELSQLIKDAKALVSYLAMALRTEQEAFSSAVVMREESQVQLSG
ncbi:hypothetical protein WJX72_003147 [[Myrmecia] bisecta]|uniref:BAR domain-containing protein n=1 Tax=[Myrmecia] bisecta TaxID=41462 RepID=A0AAW1Q503_9CHLO